MTDDWFDMGIMNTEGEMVGSLKVRTDAVDLNKVEVSIKRILKNDKCVLTDGEIEFVGYVGDIKILDFPVTFKRFKELWKDAKNCKEKVIFT